MHPYITQLVSEERTRDMHRRAAAAQRSRLARASSQGRGRTWFGRLESQRARDARAARQPACSQPTTMAARS
jgi:hypothetical protein